MDKRIQMRKKSARMRIRMKETKENKIIEGVIWKQLLLFFFPIMIGTFFQQLYNTIDAVVVGQFAGKEALSSVGGSSAQIINLVVGFFTGLSAGASVIISQLFGAKDGEGLNKALHSAYAFSIVGGILCGILGILFAKPLLTIMNTPQELLAQSTLYVRVYFSGLIFIFVYNMGSAILRAIGDSKRPLYYLMICSVINIALDLLLVLGFHLGVAGVAIATLISQAVSAVMVTAALMYRTPGLKLIPAEIRFHREEFSTMLRIGLPTGIQSSMYSISNMIVQTVLNNFGVDTMAAWAVFGKIDSLFWMVNGAFGIAITTFVGQNCGAGKWNRVKKGVHVCLGMALVTALAFSAVFLSEGALLFRIFTQDKSVITIGLRMVAVISPTYFLFVFIEILSGALRAEGHVLVTTVMTLSGICLLRILWVTLIVPNGTLEEIVACYPVTWAICAVGMILYYWYKQRKIFAQQKLKTSLENVR